MAYANGAGIARPAPFVVLPNSPRHKALTRVRRWTRNKRRWREQRARCASGRLYADRLDGGRARPFDLGPVKHALRDVLTPKAVELVAHAYAMQRGFGGPDGFVASHATVSRMLHCSERTAGTVVRELVDLDLLEQRPEFTELLTDVEAGRDRIAGRCRSRGAKKHRELVPAYRTTARLDVAIARCTERFASRGLPEGGKTCQPTAIQPPLRGVKKGVRGRGRPERRFADQLLATRRQAETSQWPAKVFERLPDGRVAWCNEPPPGKLGAATPGDALAVRLGADDDLAAIIARAKASHARKLGDAS